MLSLFWRLVPWPATRDVVKRLAGVVIDQAAHGAEDGSLDRERESQLDERDLLVLGLRSLLVVEQPPDGVEDLLRRLPGDEPRDDRERQKQELHLSLLGDSTRRKLDLLVCRQAGIQLTLPL